MKKLKILFVSEQFWPKAAGGEVWSWDLCRELARRGNAVTVLTLKHDRTLKDVETKDGVRIRRVGNGGRNYLSRWLGGQQLISAVERHLKEERPDIVHTNAYLVNVPVAKGARKHGIPSITAVHSYFGDDWLRISSVGRVLRWAERCNLRADTSGIIHVPSKYLDQRIRNDMGNGKVCACLKEKLRVIQNWCPDTFPKAKRFKTPTLVFVGSLEPVKNPLACVAIAKKLQMPLVVVGTGSLEKRLLQAARDADVALTIIPRASHEETLAIIGGAALVLVPSVTESFSLVALESVAQGTPVAATPVGILPELPGVTKWPPKRAPSRLPIAQVKAVRERFAKRKVVDAIERAYGEALRGARR